MIVIKVELHSAITGEITQLGKMHIANDGTGSNEIGHYTGQVLRQPYFRAVTRRGKVTDYLRNKYVIWELISLMLKGMGYGKSK